MESPLSENGTGRANGRSGKEKAVESVTATPKRGTATGPDDGAARRSLRAFTSGDAIEESGAEHAGVWS